jgi:hypothetical protein
MFQRCSRDVPEMFQRCSRDVPEMFQRCSGDAAEMVQRCSRDVPEMFQKYSCCCVNFKCTPKSLYVLYYKLIQQVKNIGLHNNLHKTKKLGLNKAYASDTATHIDGDTLYIAGTRNMRDLYGDFGKLHFGLTEYAQMYKDAENVSKHNPQVTKLVGHSLSTSVSEKLRQEHPEKQLELKVLYASPLIEFGSKAHEHRFRHKFNPISMFDCGAQVAGGSVNTSTVHNYSGYDQL